MLQLRAKVENAYSQTIASGQMIPETKSCLCKRSCEHSHSFSRIHSQNYDEKFHLLFECLKGHNLNVCKSTNCCQQSDCLLKYHTLLNGRQRHNRKKILIIVMRRLPTRFLRPILPVTESTLHQRSLPYPTTCQSLQTKPLHISLAWLTVNLQTSNSVPQCLIFAR